MSQHDLERAVARATGESVATIRKRGFSEMPLHRLVRLQQRKKPVKFVKAAVA